MYQIPTIALALLLCVSQAFALEGTREAATRPGLSTDGEKKLAKLIVSAADSNSFQAEIEKLQVDGTVESVFILTHAMIELPWIPELEPKSRRDHRMPKIALEAALDKLIASTEHEKLSARYFRAVLAGDAAEAKANLLHWTLENVKKMKWNGERFIESK